MTIQRKSTVKCVILCIVTCGIYGLIWLYNIARDISNENVPDTPAASPGVVVLLQIVTGGIYGWYAWYKWGGAMQRIGVKYGVYLEDRSVLYLIIQLIMPIINMILVQEDLNRLADAPPPPGGYNPGGPQYGAPQNPYGQQPYGGQPQNPYGQQPYGGQPYTPPEQQYGPDGQPYNPGGQQYTPDGQPFTPGQPYGNSNPPPPGSPYNG